MKSAHYLLASACVALMTALPGSAITVTGVNPVPWDPTNFASPHTVINSISATLTATASWTSAGTDTYQYSWTFGDGSPASAAVTITSAGTGATVGNVYNLSTTHTYTIPSVLASGQPYTAVITVTDTTKSTVVATGNYPVVVEWNAVSGTFTAANLLQAKVNGAIDNGLWYLHTAMDRATTTNANSVVVPWGGWDGQLGNGCLNGGYACLDAGGADATDVQAFEVGGHLANGPAADPYTDDVARGLARVLYYLEPESITVSGAKTIDYDPSLTAARCSDGTLPNFVTKTCTTGTYINYNPTSTTCKGPPCTFTYDGNSNKQIIIEANDGEGDPGYQSGMMVGALVAANNPTAVATTGTAPTASLPGVLGQTYQNIIQDLIDGIGYCQYYGNSESSLGSDTGGGWEYYCAGTASDASYYDDNSPSQWNAIAEIAANRGAGIAPLQVVLDTNQVWATWSQCAGTQCTSSGYTIGEFGYSSWEPLWGPYAVTPSGMVQLAMDGVGRSDTGLNKPVTVGANTNGADHRWDMAETFYHDNFCNPVASGATVSPKAYTYGLFSFTKAMEQHDPGGNLTPITLLYDEPGETGTGIDWYGAVNGVGANAPCDGVANTLVARQQADGAWYGVDYSSTQYYFETAWSIIMLDKTSFSAAACPAALSGQGKAGSRSSTPLITVTYATYTGASTYTVLRANANTGPFVAVGNTANLAFNDQTKGLTNGDTYWYEIQPTNANGVAVCTTSTPISVTIP